MQTMVERGCGLVCYRHCYMSFPFLGATNGGTFTGAGQSNRRDRCPHSVSRPPSNTDEGYSRSPLFGRPGNGIDQR
jgi:hypothetical protein